MNSDSTPKPGHPIKQDIADRLIVELRSTLECVLDDSMIATVPMACRLKGEEWPEVFENSFIGEETTAYIFFENTNELFETTIKDVRDYLLTKEPWEDYDVCVFDKTFSWCIGVSHNDRIVVIGSKILGARKWSHTSANSFI